MSNERTAAKSMRWGLVSIGAALVMGVTRPVLAASEFALLLFVVGFGLILYGWFHRRS